MYKQVRTDLNIKREPQKRRRDILILKWLLGVATDYINKLKVVCVLSHKVYTKNAYYKHA